MSQILKSVLLTIGVLIFSNSHVKANTLNIYFNDVVKKRVRINGVDSFFYKGEFYFKLSSSNSTKPPVIVVPGYGEIQVDKKIQFSWYSKSFVYYVNDTPTFVTITANNYAQGSEEAEIPSIQKFPSIPREESYLSGKKFDSKLISILQNYTFGAERDTINGELIIITPYHSFYSFKFTTVQIALMFRQTKSEYEKNVVRVYYTIRQSKVGDPEWRYKTEGLTDLDQRSANRVSTIMKAINQ